MSELLKLRLEVRPGSVKATGIQPSAKAPRAQKNRSAEPAAAVQEHTPGRVLSLGVPRWSDERKNEVLRHLADQPGELYDLLQGTVSSGLAALQLLPADEELAADGGELETPDQAALLKLVKKRLADEPLLAFELRGLDKEALLAGVFALWTEEDGEDEEGEETHAAPSCQLAAELARLERKGPAIPTGEWLAEAAAEGSLHQPGPLFHEIAVRPFPAAPVVAEPTENWGELLVKTPRALEGLRVIMRRVAEAAALRAAGLGKLE